MAASFNLQASQFARSPDQVAARLAAIRAEYPGQPPQSPEQKAKHKENTRLGMERAKARDQLSADPERAAAVRADRLRPPVSAVASEPAPAISGQWGTKKIGQRADDAYQRD